MCLYYTNSPPRIAEGFSRFGWIIRKGGKEAHCVSDGSGQPNRGEDCPLKSKCIRSASKKPLEERRKVLYVSRRFAQQREAMEEKINTERGKLLRVNRSIQAEGVFAMTKEDMDFRRFLLRGTVKVAVEWALLSLACNILKLHYKLQDGRLGTGLVIPEPFPAGL